jgi:hypothetical protein
VRRSRVATFDRAGHGAGKGTPHIENAFKDIPPPVAVPEAAPSAPLCFRQDGRIADSETAKALGRMGGRAKAAKLRLLDGLGLSAVVGETTFGPYIAPAEELIAAQMSNLATQAGGVVGPAPASMVASACLQLAASRWAFDRGAEQGDPALMKLGSALADASRQNLLAAFSLAVREAQARPAPDERKPWDFTDDELAASEARVEAERAAEAAEEAAAKGQP